MAKNLRVYVTTADSDASPLSFVTVESTPVLTHVLPHIKSLQMDLSNLDQRQRLLLCNALREAAALVESGGRDFAELFRRRPAQESAVVGGWRVTRRDSARLAGS